MNPDSGRGATSPTSPERPSPAGVDDDLPALPVRYRSMPVLRTSVALSVVLVTGAVLLWSGFDARTRSMFTMAQVLTLAFFVVVMVGLMLAVGYSQVVASDEGLAVRNLFGTRRLAWSQVRGVQFNEGDPWAYLTLVPTQDHKDPDPLMALGIQRAAGEAAQTQVAELRRLIRFHAS